MKRWWWKYIRVYRKPYVAGVSPSHDLIYDLYPDLRAKLFGVRVPILWAIDRVYSYRFQTQDEDS